jgi:hypothetical protein
MTLVFDRSLATSDYRRVVGLKHIKAVDGLPVTFKKGDKFGTIENYVVDGKQYDLYPVHRESCSEMELLL